MTELECRVAACGRTMMDGMFRPAVHLQISKEFTGREPINVSASLPHARSCRFIANLWPWTFQHAPPPRHHHPAPLLLLKPTPSRSPPRHSPPVPMAAVTTATAAASSSSFLHRRSPACLRATLRAAPRHCRNSSSRLACRAAEVSGAESSSAAAEGAGGGGGASWVPVVPLAALPRGERRVIVQDGEEILLLWYKNQVFAIENRSPAEGAYTEGLLNAKLTQVRLDSNSRLTPMPPACAAQRYLSWIYTV
jgi:hypothetical protein